MIETKFKDTEIGKIPEEWDVFSVGKDCSVKARIGWQGLTTSEYLATGEYGLITSTDIVNGKVNWNTCVFVSEDRYKQDPNIIVANNDVLVSKDGTIGKIAVVSDIPYPTTLNSGVFVIRTKNEKISQTGLGLAFKSQYFKDFIKRLTAGSTIVHLYQKDIVKFAFSIPNSLSEQHRIASALTSIDNLISSLAKLIEKKKNIKQGAMQKLLTGKTRLKGFECKETKFKETEIGKIPEVWEMYSIGDIGTFSKGSGISRAESNTGNIPAIRYGEIYTCHNDYVKDFFSYISTSVAQHSKMLNYGDILFAASGETKEDIAKAVAFISNTTAYAGGDIIVLSPKECFDSKYLGFLLNTNNVVKQRSSKAQGDAVVHITQKSITTIKIVLPPLSEQRAIATILTKMNDDITALEAKKAKYEAVKQGMMQQLLTGKIRLIG